MREAMVTALLTRTCFHWQVTPVCSSHLEFNQISLGQRTRPNTFLIQWGNFKTFFYFSYTLNPSPSNFLILRVFLQFFYKSVPQHRNIITTTCRRPGESSKILTRSTRSPRKSSHTTHHHYTHHISFTSLSLSFPAS